MKLILLGKPLSGKGTQAEFLSIKLNIKHVSTGELLRTEIKRKTDLGGKIAPLLAKGKLVPDIITFSVLKKNLPKKNFILDGFPRNLKQEKLLEKITNIDLVVDIACSDRTILKRAKSRFSCEKCGAIYGLNFPPKKKGICNTCKKELIRRPDDEPSTVKERLEVYRKLTFPLIDFYKKKKIYFFANGEKDVIKVQKQIIQKIEKIK